MGNTFQPIDTTTQMIASSWL